MIAAGDVVIVLSAYLLGSIPFSYLLVKAVTGRDIRRLGSGNVGATNVARAAGRAVGLAALALDAGKGAAAVLLAERLHARDVVAGAVAFAAVVGHCLPVFLGFRGGKGGATALGVLAVLAPAAALLSAAVLAGVVLWTRYASLATIVTALAAPWLVLASQRLGWTPAQGAWLPLATLAISLLIVARHHANLQRLLSGSEPKLGPGLRPETRA